MLLCINKVLVIILPILAAQYALALFCLTKLAYLNLKTKHYVIWNLCILLVFFIGSITFLFYYFKNKERLKIEPYVKPDDSIIIDAPIYDNAPQSISGSEATTVKDATAIGGEGTTVNDVTASGNNTPPTNTPNDGGKL